MALMEAGFGQIERIQKGVANGTSKIVDIPVTTIVYVACSRTPIIPAKIVMISHDHHSAHKMTMIGIDSFKYSFQLENVSFIRGRDRALLIFLEQ